jgi:hypothetical protein
VVLARNKTVAEITSEPANQRKTGEKLKKILKTKLEKFEHTLLEGTHCARNLLPVLFFIYF